MRIQPREFLLIPNILTSTRLLLIPLPIIMIVRGNDLIALVLVLIGMLTDVFDGVLARRLHQVSELGKILDPLADKLATGSLVVTLSICRNFPLWAAVIVIGRDLIFLCGGLLYIMQGKATPISNLFGKLTALAWGALVLSYLTPYTVLHRVMLYIAIAMVPISFFFYILRITRRTNPNTTS